MTNWIINNKEWLFSGIGVFAISLIVTYIYKIFNRKPIVTMKQISGNNSTNFQTNGNINIENINVSKNLNDDVKKITKSEFKKEEIERQNFEVRIKEGDYIDIPWGSKLYKITLKHIVNEVFKKRLAGEILEGVEIYVNTSGGLVFGGEYAKRSDVNQWKIPLKDETQEEPYSVYSHFVYDGSLSFFRCFVSHINHHSREAVLNVFLVRVTNSA